MGYGRKKYLIIVAGPTAVGKTGMAIDIALQTGTEIVNADSRQVYQELNIGVARPDPGQLKAVRHHLVAFRTIYDPYDAGSFARDFDALSSRIFQEQDYLVVCGGTGLYLKSITSGLDEFPSVDPAIIDGFQQQHDNEGIEVLQNQLKEADPEYYRKVDLSNSKRLIRALGVIAQTGTPYSSFLVRKERENPYEVIPILLELPRDILYDHINKRVEQMLEAGLVEEARAVYPHRHLRSLHTVGYSELFHYFDGILSLDEAIDKIRQHTRNYAKRQLTWFKNQENWTRFSPDDLPGALEFIRKMSRF